MSLESRGQRRRLIDDPRSVRALAHPLRLRLRSIVGHAGQITAANAARCDTLATFEVACDCRFAAAFTTSTGPISQPTRHPVMA